MNNDHEASTKIRRHWNPTRRQVIANRDGSGGGLDEQPACTVVQNICEKIAKGS